MNWDNVKVFIAVTRRGSIAKAAADLDMNHSTVLRRLASLEDELNIKLFNRLPKGYEITPAGEDLLEQAVRVENEALELQRKAACSKTENSGKLEIALPPDGALDLVPILTEFRAQHSHIELNFESQQQLKDINRLEAEAAIRFTTTPPMDCVGYKVLSIPNKLYASKNYFDNHQPFHSLEQIKDWLIVYLPPDKSELEHWVRDLNPDAAITMRTNSMAFASEAVANDMGVTFLSEHIAKKFENLVELPINPFKTAVEVWVLTHPDLRYHPRVKLFVDFIRKKLALRYPQYATAIPLMECH